MGYELDKLMKQYGIGTASVAPYSGTEKPVAPTDTSASDYAQKMADYQQNLAKYNIEYPAYQQYVTDYKNRLANTPQYLAAQYQTTPVTMPSQEAQDALKAAAGKYNVSQQQIDDLAKKYNLSNKDIFNVTGSYYGAPLANPSAPKQDYTTDYDALVKSAYGTLGRSGFGTNANQIDQQGYDYWLNQLKTGAIDPGKFLTAFKSGVKDTTNTGTGTGINTGTNTGTNTNTTDYDNLIKNAYATQNRYGFGAESNQIDQPGYDYWLNQLKTGAVTPDNFLNVFKSGASDGSSSSVGHNARGGLIKNYSRGGPEDRGLTALAAGYDVPDITQTPNPESLPMVFAQSAPTNDAGANPPAAAAPSPAPYSFNSVGITAAPASGEPAAPAAPAAGGTINPEKIMELFKKYNTGNDYSTEIKAASEKAKAETDAFRNMLANAMKGNEANMPSKAEMYFRLAAALGAPTKTRGMSESISNAASAMADFQKATTEAQRTNAAQNLQLALKGQELGMQTAKEELANLRNLQGEENKDKRLLFTETMKEYIKSGEPQSAAGKQARDEGLQPGTTAYQKRVNDIVQTGVDAKTAELNKKLTDMTNENARLLLQQQKQAKQEAELTTPELELKQKTEDALATTNQAVTDLKKAYELSPKAFSNSLADVAQRKVLETTNPTHPRVVATREMENLLELEALSKLKSTFPGAISDAESSIILKLQGIGSKSPEERDKIIKNAYETLQTVKDRMQKRLEDVKSGKYKEKTKEGEQ
jgi:hypothetical protein